MGGITIKKIQELEEKSEKLGVSKLDLMENAGKKIGEILQEKKDLKGKKILIVCYHGNNGGDGFVAARYLADNCEVDVLFIGEEEKMKKEAIINYEKMMKRYDIQVLRDPLIDYDEYDIIIDALLGTGAKDEIIEPITSLIEFINKSKAYKVSVDIPTGINPDTGAEANKFVNPDLIITMHDMKKGLEKFKDKTVIADIGLKTE